MGRVAPVTATNDAQAQTLIPDWSSLDDRAVATGRALAMDAVQRVGNGHPGTAMTLSPVAYLIFQRFCRIDPVDPSWIGRDRFVLSCGHSSLTLYIQLYLSGYGLDLADLESFRTWGSRTPGHPEHGHTAGVETTTGPLGQGVATAVGMAMGARFERGLFDPDAPQGSSPFDHHVWVIASDGDLEEGISGEASSLAGTQKLSNLTVVWDDNHISIEGDTAIAFTEDVAARYRAYGWNVIEIERLSDGDIDLPAVYAALEASRNQTAAPTFIQMRSTIAWPAPNARGTAKAHGSALGAAEIAATKELLGFDPEKSFQVEDDVLAHARLVATRGAQTRREWDSAFNAWAAANPERAALLERIRDGRLPDLAGALPEFADGTSIATRAASGKVINALAAVMPELWGGSADLAESNNTTIEGGGSFLPVGSTLPDASPYGRILHFGIREHAMGAILNGMSLSGLNRPFGGTFLVFSDYMRGAVRLSALMQTPVTYVWTHDSIGLGEDGPTHQPVEHLWSLRAIPGLSVVRPCDARETAGAWLATLGHRHPVGLILSRQNLPTVAPHNAPVHRGAYVLADAANGQPQVVIIATGSEVQIALAAKDILDSEGVAARVVSMPCVEWFDAEDQAYRDSVIPPNVSARVSVEAGLALGWWKYVGTHGRCVSLEHFGASADQATLFREFGISAQSVADAAKASLADSKR